MYKPTMFALGYKYQEDVWYGFDNKDITTGLNFSCLLPTRDVAEYVLENLNDDFSIVEITIESFSPTGALSLSFDTPEEWMLGEEFEDWEDS